MMNGYFNNIELKKSSAALLLIMAVFLTCNYFVIRANNERLKNDYLEVLGSITSMVVEKSPELEKEIVPLMINKISKEEAARGKEILVQYGLRQGLENNLFPHVNSTFRNNEITILFAGLLLTVLLFILNYLQCGYFYKNIRAFNQAAKRIVEGNYNLKLSFSFFLRELAFLKTVWHKL